MTALRENAINLVEQVPEDKLYFVIQFLKDMDGLHENIANEKKIEAVAMLKGMRRRNDTIDYDAELAKYREEKYGDAGAD